MFSPQYRRPSTRMKINDLPCFPISSKKLPDTLPTNFYVLCHLHPLIFFEVLRTLNLVGPG